MDQIVRAIAKNAPVKAMAISARDTVERARAIHDCWPVAAAPSPLWVSWMVRLPRFSGVSLIIMDCSPLWAACSWPPP